MSIRAGVQIAAVEPIDLELVSIYIYDGAHIRMIDDSFHDVLNSLR